MKRTLLILVSALAVALLFLAGRPRAEGVTVRLNEFITMLTYNFDGTKLLGDMYMNIIGSEGGRAVLTMENESGEVVFKRSYTCEKNYYGGDVPECSISPGADAEISEELESGAYKLKLQLGGEEIYTLDFSVHVEVSEYDQSKSICVSGGWNDLAVLETSAEPAVVVTFYTGGPDLSGHDPVELQTQVFREGEFFSRGHMHGYFYYGCSMSSVQLALFSEDENHFTKWTKSADFTNGNYEVRLFVNGEVSKTYPFTVSAGEIKPVIPEGIADGLNPEKIHDYEGSVWIVAK